MEKWRFKRNKYHAKKVEFDGITFDSKVERDRYIFLLSEAQAGNISDLQRQVKFELLPSFYEDVEIPLKTKIKIVTKLVQRGVDYYADFVYTNKNGDTIVEDVKGMRTNEYKLKKKMMYAVHKIKIKEIKKPTQVTL